MKPAKLAAWSITKPSIALSVVLFVAIAVLRVPGAQLYVNLNSATPAFPFSNWSTAATNIQDAVDAALAGDLILVTNGVYQTGTRSLDAATTNRVVINKSVVVQSVNGATVTQIDGGGAVRCSYLGAGARLAGFTLTNGFSSTDGGGAFGATSNSVLSNCVIIGCFAANGGGLYGGMAVNCAITSCGNSETTSGGGCSGSTLINCLIKNNMASNAGGASASTLVGCEVIANTATYSAGGLQGCSASFCNVSGNIAQADIQGYGYGGGTLSCTLANCIVSGNAVQPRFSCCQGAGGGVAEGTATDCVIQGNSVSGNGGGAWGAILHNCIVTDNQAVSGGGTWRCGVVGSFLSGNFAATDAGADFASGMVDCTIVGNYSAGGVAGVNGSSLYNCIVYFNIIVFPGGYNDLPSHNSANASFNYCCTVPLPPSGAGNITNIPTFQSDGFHLTAGSPCRGAGALANTLGVDIDGRPWLNPPSIGCAEYYTTPPPALALQANYTNVHVGNPLDLQAAVSGGQLAYLLWNFGDNSTDGSGLTTSHVWTAPGDYTVLLTAFFSGTPLTAARSVVIHVASSDSPTISTQPADQAVTEGGTAQFSVVAGGSPVFAYQWRFNCTDLPGATNASLRLTYLQTNQAGWYSVVVFNPLYYPPGQITSSNAVLTVTLPVCRTPPPGLVAWWRAEGDFTDAVDGNNGIHQNVSFASGKVGQAFVFADGASSLSVPASPTLNIGSGGLSIEGWIQPDAFALSGSGAPIIAWDAGTTNLLQFWAGSTLLAGFVDTQGTAHTLRSDPGWLDTNHWQHVAFTYDVASGAAAIYVNGNVAGTTNLGTVPPQIAGTVNIGWSASTANFFGGLMDELSLYNRALSPTEILALFNAGQAGKCNVTVAPTVVAQPQNTFVLPGAVTRFAVVAAGTAPLSYQWLLDGNPINGATDASLVLSNASCSQNGSLYSVAVSNAGGSVASSNALLTIINTPPQISSISNQVVSYFAPFVTVPFWVANGGLPASSVTVSGASSNTNLIPNGQIVFNGADTNRTVTLTANSNTFGTATISVIAKGPCGATNQSSFNLLVTNLPPQISTITNQRAPLNAIIGPLAFTVSDAETPADQLVVTAITSNNSIVPTNQIVVAGAGTSRTVAILPGTNSAGTATVTLKVTDALGASKSTSFSVQLDQFTQIATGLPPLTYSAVAWGDYDNDGQLDLLVSGTTNGAASGAITRVYRNTGGAFTNFISLTNLFKSAVSWGDYDHDGRLDAVVSGINLANVPATRLYHNNGDGTFTEVNAGFAGVYSGSLAWGDVDNDGAPDLFLSGLTIVSSNGPTPITTNLVRLYRNHGDGTFADMNVSLLTTNNRVAGPNNGSASWGDFDNDGKLDLLLVGLINNTDGMASVFRNLGHGVFTNVFSNGTIARLGGAGAWGDYDNDGWLDFVISGGSTSVIYRNNGNGTFTPTNFLSGAATPSVAWGDFNNDGYLDLLVSGDRSSLYRNNGRGSLVASGIALPSTFKGASAWGDFNHDGNLDLIFAGGTTEIYQNNNGISNTPPTAPTGLAFTRSNNVIALAWTKSTDPQTTNANGLNYQLRVGTAPGGVQVESPPAALATGFRRTVQAGEVSTNQWRFSNLPPGTYYWSVQAIDTAFAGSPFAVESTFVVLPPPVARPDGFSTPINTPATFAADELTLNDFDPGGYPLAVIAVSAKSARNATVSLASGRVTYTPPTDFSGNDTFSYTVSDGQSAAATGTVFATVGAGGPVSLNIVSVSAIENGNFVVRFAGIPGRSYTIEAAADLGGPWAKVANLTAPTSDQGLGVGVFEFRRSILANSIEFYRTVYPAY